MSDETTLHSYPGLGVKTDACQMQAVEILDSEFLNPYSQHAIWRHELRLGLLPAVLLPAVLFELSKPPLLLGPWHCGEGLKAATANAGHELRPATPKPPVKDRASSATTESKPPYSANLIFVDEAQFVSNELERKLYEGKQIYVTSLQAEYVEPKPPHAKPET